MIYNEIKRIEEAKAAIRQAIIDKNIDVPSTDTIDIYPEYISQIHTGGDDRWHCDDPLCIEPASGTIYISLNRNADNTLNDRLVLPEFSYNKQEWIEWKKDNEGEFPTIEIGGDGNPQKVYIRGVYIQPPTGNKKQFVISSSQRYVISGNPISLIEGLKGELYDSCFNLLFIDSGVVDASRLVLNSTTLKPYCYDSMFQGCTELTQAPSLPATTLAEGCYANMFSLCSNLAQSPALPATEIASNSYSEMFKECRSIHSVTLPMTRINSNGCSRMFYNCTGLETVDMSALTLIENNGCNEMFNGCNHLTSVADMNLTSIGNNGCASMFINCVLLETAPELIASNGAITSAGEKCMYYMFKGCRGLKLPPSKLTFNITTANSTICQYMFDGCVSLEKVPSITSQKNIGSYAFSYMFNGCTGLTDASDAVFEVAKSSQYMYYYMFTGCTALTKGPARLVFNTMTAGNECTYMFAGCISLTQAPELPATTLATYCYSYMFQNCKALTQSPALPATTLATYCYSYMFQNCTALTQAPSILPAVTLVSNCYNQMFYGCTSLETAPELPANTLVSNCYYRMFYNCSKLKSITVRATSWNTSYANNWVYGVSSTGNFYKPASTTIATGVSGIPSGWGVQEIH